MSLFASEPNVPKLKLEVIRSGNGPGRPTAIGLDEGAADNEPNYVLSEAPSWFKLMMPIVGPYVRKVVHQLPHEQRAVLLRKSKLSRRYRVLLSFIWKFELHESICTADAKELFAASSGGKELSALKSLLEQYSVWQIWLYLNS